MGALFIGLIVFASVLLAIVILVQNPKGGGLSSSLGSSSQGSQMFGVQRTTDFLTTATYSLAGVVAVLVLFYNLSNQPQSISTMNDSDATVEQAAPTGTKAPSGTKAPANTKPSGTKQ